MIGSFIVDFYCSKLLLAIEVDGESHNDRQIYDTVRDEDLRHR
jgi:very-short-patch-repair endonuclease